MNLRSTFTNRYTENIGWLDQAKDWVGLKSIGMVEYEKIMKATGETQIERRCFILLGNHFAAFLPSPKREL